MQVTLVGEGQGTEGAGGNDVKLYIMSGIEGTQAHQVNLSLGFQARGGGHAREAHRLQFACI